MRMFTTTSQTSRIMRMMEEELFLDFASTKEAASGGERRHEMIRHTHERLERERRKDERRNVQNDEMKTNENRTRTEQIEEHELMQQQKDYGLSFFFFCISHILSL